MTDNEYTMACRYKESIKRYEEMKMKISELYKKVKDSGHDEDVMALAEMIHEAVGDDTGKGVLFTLVCYCEDEFDKKIKICEESFKEL